MLSFSGSLRVFVAVETCDMRKGFEGLSALVGSALNEEVKRGALFAFCNRRRTRLKILYFDGSGLRTCWLPPSISGGEFEATRSMPSALHFVLQFVEQPAEFGR